MSDERISKIIDEIGGKKKLDISLLGDETSPCIVSEWLSTGCTVLDKIMTGSLPGGLPVGRITEIYGDESTGKSLLASQISAYAQELGVVVMYADTESAVSIPMMQEVGVDINKLIYFSPETIEQVFEGLETAIEINSENEDNPGLLFIWDSVAASSVSHEMDSEYGKPMMGKHANIISQSLRKINKKIAKNRVTALFLNQTRQKIGVLFGDKEATFGGKAIPFYASLRVRLKPGGKIKEGKRLVGVNTTAMVVKSRISKPYRKCILPIYFGHGVDDYESTFEYVKYNELVEKSGSWYVLNVNGKEEKFQRKNWAEVYEKYYDEIIELIDEFDEDFEQDFEDEIDSTEDSD